MKTQKTLLAMILATSLGVSVGTYAAVAIDIDVAPPAPRHENAPPRAGYIYTPGYYKWDDSHHQHVWTDGEYQAERHGEHYVAQKWTEKDGHYHSDDGRWEKDKGQ
jgi:hypothetical protein